MDEIMAIAMVADVTPKKIVNTLGRELRRTVVCDKIVLANVELHT
jgi:hypothetical protein